MIDEGTLAGLLSDHAERIPVPVSAVDALLAASPRLQRTSTRRPSARVLSAVVTVVLGAGALWIVGARSEHGSHSVDASGTRRPAVTTPTGPVLTPPTTAARALRSSGNVTDDTAEGFAGAPPGARELDSTTLSLTGKTNAGAPAQKKLTDGARVVRTGTLDLHIARHGFGETIGRITTIAASAGGFVTDASTVESAATPSGTVTVRVPSARFDASVERLRALGKVESGSSRSVDVTGQYTDLQARLRAAGATRDQYLTVLAKATSIGDILAVQDRLQSVQTQIEQLRGQIQQLGNQAAYGTITISVNEPAPKPQSVVGPHHRSGISIAWGNARSGFARRVEGLISHSGSAVVVLLGLLLVAAALRMLVPRMRRLFV